MKSKSKAAISAMKRRAVNQRWSRPGSREAASRKMKALWAKANKETSK